ncbi:MAG: ankyrin repeat domain-containing protein [Phycisphaeraceae bacterium]|nr:ankyrin repeat domain-containing protein [Phycisphaeraceae bacterium]
MPGISRRAFISETLALAGVAAIGAPGRAATRRPRDPDVERFLRAVEQGDGSAVQRMLAAEPGLASAHDGLGRSAFALALLNRHSEVGGMIRAAGYEPDVHESALALDWPRLDELARRDPPEVNRDHPIGGSAMLAAAMGGAGDQIWRVYQYGGDPNARPRGARGISALRGACEFPDLDGAEVCAATLLGNGADPSLPEPDGVTALHVAASRGSTAIVEILLRKDAPVDARDGEGLRAVDHAERAGHERAAAMLRDHRSIARDHSTSRRAYDASGAEYRAPDFDGLSIMERGPVVGASHTNLDAVRAAVGRDARLAHSVAMTTEAAVEAGAHMGRHDIVEFLLSHGAPYSLPTAVMRGDAGRVRALLKEDPARITERGAHDFALLWYPVIGGGRIDLMELLLDAGASIEGQHYLGTTALHWAAMNGQVDMAALLIERGADLNRIGRKFSGERLTPLQLALQRGREDVAALLRDRGATE